jgi:hypothetical protein
MYIQCNIETRSCNHCYCVKVLSAKYSETVFVALVIQHAMRMRHIVPCGLPGYTIFSPHYLKNCTIFEKKSY